MYMRRKCTKRQEKKNFGQTPEKQPFKFGDRFRKWQETEKDKERKNLAVCGMMNIKEREG